MPLSTRLGYDGFTAAQAAQKDAELLSDDLDEFTAAQAAQKVARDDLKRAIRFTAAQAAQKVPAAAERQTR